MRLSATATANVSSFGGRCKTHNEYETSNTLAHECEAGPNATKTENFTGYKDYMERRKNCMKINGCPCQCRDGSIFKNMTTWPQNSTCPTLSVVNLGVETNSNVGKYILRSRKAHGMAMLVVTMVFVPFTILVSRYFKETWLSHAQLSNLQIWYLVHIGLTFLTVCLYIFGSVSLRRSKALVGDSLFGETHRGLGWATITFFTLTAFTGPVRPISNASQMTRKCVMFIHALLGIVYYCLGMAAVITSSYIPGSPSSSEVACFTSPSYTEYSSSPTIPLVVTWIVMDFGFHLLLRWADKSLHIQRSMYLPLVSILKYGGHHDMKGFRYRKLMLIIYGICNFGIVLELIIRLANSTKAGCSFGPVTCTFTSGGEKAGNGSFCREFCTCQRPSARIVNSVCIGTGYNDDNYFSIGQKPFRSDYTELFNKRHNKYDNGNIEPSESKTLVLKMYAVETTHGRILSGWLYIRIYVPVGADWIRLLYAQMEDENGNAIGEFVNREICESKKRAVISDLVNRHLSEHYVPCGQVAPAATTASNAFLYVWPDKIHNSAMKQRLIKHYGSSWFSTQTIDINWKFSHTSCDKPKKVRLRAYIYNVDQGNGIFYGTHRGSWININWIGTADILNPGEKGYCNKPPIPDPTLAVPWIKSVDEKINPTEETTNKDIVRSKNFCKPVYIGDDPAIKNVSSFGGRCLKHDEYNTSNTFAHECSAGAMADANFTKYSEYLEKRTSCIQINGCPCQCRVDPIDNTSGLEEPTCPGSKKDLTLQIKMGVKTNGTAGKYIMRSRKAHGIAMLFVTMVLVPYSILVSRYFKETWLKNAKLNLQVWYLVHIVLTFFSICCYLFGSVSLRRSKNVLGESLIVSTHREQGWSTIALFLLATFTGPFRPISSQKTRKCAMIIHALVGIIYYCCGMAAVITSAWIPGSPSGSEEDCFTSPSYTEYSSSPTIPLVVTWIVIDFGFHLLLRWADRRLNIQRSMYLPLVSILKYEGHHDMKFGIQVLQFIIGKFSGIPSGSDFVAKISDLRLFRAMSRGVLAFLLVLGINLSPREFCSSQNPYAELVNSICIGSGLAKETYFSIGQLPFRSLYSGTFENYHSSIASGNTEASEKRTLVVKIYAVKTSTDRFLEGWLYITVNVPSGKGRFRQFYVQMEDENGNAVGEFVNKVMCSSKKKKRDVAQSRKVISAFKDRHLPEYYIPCGQVPNTIVYSWHDKIYNPALYERLNKHYGSSSATTSTSLNWRFSHTSCDKPQKIRLRAYIYTDQSRSGTHRSSWINVNWFGAADVLQEGERGICKGLQIYPPPSTPGSPVRWIKSVDEKIPPTEATTNKDIVRTKKFCKPVYITRSIGAVVEHVPSFGGRCLKHDEYQTSNTLAHQCTAGATIDANFTKYSEYLERRTSCMQINGCPCQCRADKIDNTSGLVEPTCPGFISGRDQKERIMKQIKLGITTTGKVGKGILLRIKIVEIKKITRDSYDFCINGASTLHNSHIQVHVIVTFFTICFYLCGSLALTHNNKMLGHSLKPIAKAHRGMGIATFVLFVLVTLTGPLRRRTVKRKSLMIIHAGLGVLYYFCGMVALITSSWIPGSPSADDTECITSQFFIENSSSRIMPQVITWVIFDCWFHGIFMMMQRWADKHMGIRRKMYFPLLPIFIGREVHDNKVRFAIKVMSTIGSSYMAGSSE
ncbi:Ferric-chelate reductase 1 [Orchesella cincta]|uniref:ascorbate ferrireductase (transmembrane) n=1 Tax=Orchesella cincta TaxID=48709 RepID=A0A1D2MTT6_ORCCI|nr:Ferric-chelate reductase 1 [Orchesella cincta]